MSIQVKLAVHCSVDGSQRMYLKCDLVKLVELGSYSMKLQGIKGQSTHKPINLMEGCGFV